MTKATNQKKINNKKNKTVRVLEYIFLVLT